MTTKRLNELVEIAVNEIRNERLCIIEDIFKVRKMLFAMDVPGHHIPADEYGNWFDHYMEMKFEDLEVHLAELSAKMSRKARELAGYYRYQKNNDCDCDGN